MTCAAAYFPASGAIIVRGAFPEIPSIADRARNDRMGSLYQEMRDRKELAIYPGRVTPVTHFIESFMRELNDHGAIPIAIGADRYRRAEAIQAYEEAGLPKSLKVFWRGQGASKTADGSFDVRAFQRNVISGKLKTLASPMLECAIANSRLRYDGSGNPALDKTASNARIDALSASVIAVGIAETIPPGPLLGMRVHVV